MKTNNSYINENSFSDDVIEYTESCLNDLINDVNKFNHSKRQIELKSLFEGVSINAMENEFSEFYEKEGTNIFAKIGNFILGIIHKISEFLNKIVEKFTKNSKNIESDKDKVNKIINEHPDLRNAVCQGIREEWFTYADIASYEKDIVGLVNMLEKNIVSHQEIEEKFEQTQKKFENPLKKVVSIGSTIAGVLGTVTLVVNSVKEANESITSCQAWLKHKHDEIRKKREEKRKKKTTVTTIESVITEGTENDNYILMMKIIGKYSSSLMKYSNNVNNGLSFVSGQMKNVIEKYNK